MNTVKNLTDNEKSRFTHEHVTSLLFSVICQIYIYTAYDNLTTPFIN